MHRCARASFPLKVHPSNALYSGTPLTAEMMICHSNCHSLRISSSRTLKIACASELGHLRKQLLEKVDEELRSGNDRGALAFVKDLHGKSGGLRCFGAARQVLNEADFLII